MIMKNVLLSLFSLVCFAAIAQQKPQFSQYMLNKFNDNPAYGGLERSLSIYTSYRDQYSAFTGNPRTFYLGADMPFYIWNGAIGFTLYNQRAGVFSNTNFKLSYNYVINTSVGFLSIGGRAGIDMLNVDGSRIVTPEGSYNGGFDHNDPILSNTNYNGFGPSWETGIYFYGRYFESGFVLSELPTHRYKLGDGTYSRALIGSFFAQYKYLWDDRLKFLPSIMIKSDMGVLQTDIGIVARYYDNLLVGINYRGYSKQSNDAFSVIVGTNLGKKYFVSYSYDFGLSQLKSVHEGSHEVMLSYNLQKLIGIGLPPKIIYNPRDL